MVKNKESACVSVPPQVKEADGHYVWKTDLQATSKFWSGTDKFFRKVLLLKDGSKTCPVCS